MTRNGNGGLDLTLGVGLAHSCALPQPLERQCGMAKSERINVAAIFILFTHTPSVRCLIFEAFLSELRNSKSSSNQLGNPAC